MTISPLATIKNAYVSMAPDGVVAEITDEMVGKRVDFILLFDAPILTTGPIKFGGPLAQLFGTDQLVPIIAGPTFLIFNEVVFDVDANFEDVYISILSGVTDALGIPLDGQQITLSGPSDSLVDLVMGADPTNIAITGGEDVALSVDENTTFVTDLATTNTLDSEGAGLTYAIDGGADAAAFSIDAATGIVSFVSAPDFEIPGDTGGDNIYDLTVRVTDSLGRTDTQNLAISVTDVTVLTGTADADKLRGSDEYSTIDGLAGSDIMIGSDSAEVFVMSAGDRDRVKNFNAGTDKVDLGAWGTSDFSELTILGKEGSWKIYDSISKNIGIVAMDDRGPDATQLTAADFIFAEQTVFTLTGTAEKDNLIGRTFDEILDGGLGRDTYTGNGGADTFVLGADAKDQVLDFEDGIDLLDVSDWGVADVLELQFKNMKNGGVVISDSFGHRARVFSDDGLLRLDDLTDGSDFIFAA